MLEAITGLVSALAPHAISAFQGSPGLSAPAVAQSTVPPGTQASQVVAAQNSKAQTVANASAQSVGGRTPTPGSGHSTILGDIIGDPKVLGSLPPVAREVSELTGFGPKMRGKANRTYMENAFPGTNPYLSLIHI